MSAEFRIDQASKTLFMDGVIGVADAGEFRRLIAGNDLARLGLSGPGGTLRAALAIGEQVQSAGLATFIPAGQDCASGCALVFVHGREREVGENGRLGFHLPFIGFSPDPTTDSDEKARELERYCRLFSREADGPGREADTGRNAAQAELPAEGPAGRGMEEPGRVAFFRSCIIGTYRMSIILAYKLTSLFREQGIGEEVLTKMLSGNSSKMRWYGRDRAEALNLATPPR
ncbi:hypothetical protein ACQ5SP_14890 [Rhodovulum sp. YNF3179]